MEFTLSPITVILLTDVIAAAALALPCDPLEVQPVHVQGLHVHIDLSFQGFLVLGFGKCNMAASGPSLWCHPGQRGPYCPTDHGKDLEGIIILINPEAMPLKATSNSHLTS